MLDTNHHISIQLWSKHQSRRIIMPNHVLNHLTAAPHVLASLAGTPIGEEKERLVDFNTIIPQPEDLFRGNLSREDEERTQGHNWYTWNIDNWGTKWNAYGAERISWNTIKFETAWSTPFPVIEELSRKFPEESITLAYSDEDIGSNCGLVLFRHGLHEYIQEFKGYSATEHWPEKEKLAERKRGDDFAAQMRGYADYAAMQKEHAEEEQLYDLQRKRGKAYQLTYIPKPFAFYEDTWARPGFPQIHWERKYCKDRAEKLGKEDPLEHNNPMAELHIGTMTGKVVLEREYEMKAVFGLLLQRFGVPLGALNQYIEPSLRDNIQEFVRKIEGPANRFTEAAYINGVHTTLDKGMEQGELIEDPFEAVVGGGH